MRSKYHRTLRVDLRTGSGDFVEVSLDVYDILQMWGVTNPAIAHAIKKLLMPGQRGDKSRTQDIEEAILSLQRALELDTDVGGAVRLHGTHKQE